MTRLLQQPVELEVKEGNRFEPVAFPYKGRMVNTGQILKRWRISQGWWKRPVEREYFQIKTEAGMVCELYRDLIAGAWYLQRIYD